MHTQPSLEDIQKNADEILKEDANVIPLVFELPSNLYSTIDSRTAFKRVRRDNVPSFLLESAEVIEGVHAKGKADYIYSIIGTEPFATLRVEEELLHNKNDDATQQQTNTTVVTGDPLLHLERELEKYKTASRYTLKPNLLNGGALGYIGYDCVRHFEPRVAPSYPLQDVLKVPEALFLMVNSMILFNHTSKTVQIVALCGFHPDSTVLAENYRLATLRITELYERMLHGQTTEFVNRNTNPSQGVSNVGQSGYEGMVKKLKEHIVDGDIIQAVPSQRVKRPTGVHPFHIYEQLRELNPSRYMFYIDLLEFQLVGASPELLVQVHSQPSSSSSSLQSQRRQVVTHPIAGTRHRGDTPEEDIRLAQELISDEKERAEHIMLVDLGRNDVNRVAEPSSTTVNNLMHIERYSHVMHIVSEVTGQLRGDCTPLDAFRSIFPAGTVSGAPKIKAMELIARLEGEKRGVYAGAVGVFSFQGDIDTCIALRTMVMKDGVAYLQAGGGIVYDSQPTPEYEETVNKMAAIARAIDRAEQHAAAASASDHTATNTTTTTESNHNNHQQSSSSLSSSVQDFNTFWSQFGKTISSSSSSNDIIQQSSVIIPLHSHQNNNTITGSSTTTTSITSNANPTAKGNNRLLLIDNYDSFTWNLYQYLCQLGQDVTVFRNDAISVEDCLKFQPDRVVISPGPSWPKDAGISSEVLRAFTGKVPVLGVCLGHECMTEVFGGVIEHCGEIVHGKTSPIQHDGKGVFTNLPNHIQVIRYHSLAASTATLPDVLEVSASTANGVIMGLRHKQYTVEGVQFHPESIKSEYGMEMLKNFIQIEGTTWDK